MAATHEPDHDRRRMPWPDGFREHLVDQLDGFSPLVSRAIADNGASLFGDGPYRRRRRTGILSAISRLIHG